MGDLELYKKGYIKAWCLSCCKTTLHRPVKFSRTYCVKATKYTCTQCGALREFPHKRFDEEN